MEKQELIFTAALNLFVQFGFHGTPTSKIAEEAGVSNGTLFHYFSTKDELITELYSKLINHRNTQVKNNVEATTGFKNRFQTFHRISVSWATANKDSNYFLNQVEFSPYNNLVHSSIKQDNIEIHNQLLIYGLTEKLFRPLDREFARTISEHHIKGTVTYINSRPLRPDDKSLAIENSFRILWNLLAYPEYHI